MNAGTAPARPAAGAAIASEASCGIGIDIGGTKALGVAIGAGGEVLAEVLLSSGFGPVGVLDAMAEVVRRLREALPTHRVLHVGVGVPGTVDPLRGEVRQALNLGIEHLTLGPALADRLGVPVHVENDVNVAALGAAALADADGPRSLAGPEEARSLSGQDGPRSLPGRSLAYLNLGTGLAVGLVLDGEMWRGSRGAAGEIGHVPLDPAGAVCICGLRGCLELYASGSGIARQWGEDVPLVAAIEALAADGEPRAQAIVERLVWAVASAVRLILLANDVERVVVGGGIAAALGGRLLDPVREVLRGWEAGSAFLASLAPSARVSLVPARVPVAALGAAHAALRALGSATDGPADRAAEGQADRTADVGAASGSVPGAAGG